MLGVLLVLALVTAGCTGGSGVTLTVGSTLTAGSTVTGSATGTSDGTVTGSATGGPDGTVTADSTITAGTSSSATGTSDDTVTGSATGGPDGTVTAGTSSSPTGPSPTPVTPEGMATGPGVTATSITLGLLVDPSADRGFTDGVRLWQQTANAAGGICGRSIQLVSSGSQGVPADLSSAYRAIGRQVLGLATLASSDDADKLAQLAGGDGVPGLTPAGTSGQLRSPGPVVVGPTADILAINALAYLVSAKLVTGQTVGVLTDGSPVAADALAGLDWQARQAGLNLLVRSPQDDLASWGGAGSVVSLVGPADTARLLTTGPKGLTVITTLDGYDAGLIPAEDAPRLLVVTPTPAFDSKHPAVTAVAAAFARSGGTEPGPRLLAGYALGGTWGRVLSSACSDLALTRTGVAAAMAAIGPAPVDSLLGPADPALVVTRQRPATRLSAVSAADPAAPTGLRGLTWLQAAGDIASYVPGG